MRKRREKLGTYLKILLLCRNLNQASDHGRLAVSVVATLSYHDCLVVTTDERTSGPQLHCVAPIQSAGGNQAVFRRLVRQHAPDRCLLIDDPAALHLLGAAFDRWNTPTTLLLTTTADLTSYRSAEVAAFISDLAAVSRPLAEHIGQRFRKPAVHWVPATTGNECIAPLLIATSNESAPTIGYAGDLSRRHDLAAVAGIFAAASQRYGAGQLRLAIAGGADQDSAVRHQVAILDDVLERAGLGDRVTYEPRAAADLWLFCNRLTDELPLALLDAAAAGNMVLSVPMGLGVVTDLVPQIGELIDLPKGHFCPQSIGAAASQVVRLLTDADRRQWAAMRGPELVAEEYSPRVFSDQLRAWAGEPARELCIPSNSSSEWPPAGEFPATAEHGASAVSRPSDGDAVDVAGIFSADLLTIGDSADTMNASGDE